MTLRTNRFRCLGLVFFFSVVASFLFIVFHAAIEWSNRQQFVEYLSSQSIRVSSLYSQVSSASVTASRLLSVPRRSSSGGEDLALISGMASVVSLGRSTPGLRALSLSLSRETAAVLLRHASGSARPLTLFVYDGRGAQPVCVAVSADSEQGLDAYLRVVTERVSEGSTGLAASLLAASDGLAAQASLSEPCAHPLRHTPLPQIASHHTLAEARLALESEELHVPDLGVSLPLHGSPEKPSIAIDSMQLADSFPGQATLFWRPDTGLGAVYAATSQLLLESALASGTSRPAAGERLLVTDTTGSPGQSVLASVSAGEAPSEVSRAGCRQFVESRSASMAAHVGMDGAAEALCLGSAGELLLGFLGSSSASLTSDVQRILLSLGPRASGSGSRVSGGTGRSGFVASFPVAGTPLQILAETQQPVRLPKLAAGGIALTALVLSLLCLLASVPIQCTVRSVAHAVRELAVLARPSKVEVPVAAPVSVQDDNEEIQPPQDDAPPPQEEETSEEAFPGEFINETTSGTGSNIDLPLLSPGDLRAPDVQHVISQAVPSLARSIAELRARGVPQQALETVAAQIMTLFAVGGFADDTAAAFRSTEQQMRSKLTQFSGQLAEVVCGTAQPPQHSDAFKAVSSVVSAVSCVAAQPDGQPAPAPALPPADPSEEPVRSYVSFAQAIRESHIPLLSHHDIATLTGMDSLQRSDYANELRWYLLQSSLAKQLGTDTIVELATAALNEARRGTQEVSALCALVEAAYLAEVLDGLAAPPPSDVASHRLHFGMLPGQTCTGHLCEQGRLAKLQNSVDSSWYTFAATPLDARVMWPLDRPTQRAFPPSFLQPNGGPSCAENESLGQAAPGSPATLAPLAKTLFMSSRSPASDALSLCSDLDTQSKTEADSEENLGRLLFEQMLGTYQEPGSLPLLEGAVVRDSVKRLALCLQTFSRYVPSCVVSDLLRDASEAHVGVQPGEVTVFVLDLASFTTLAEKLNQQQIHSILSAAFEVFCTHINRHRGFVNKFAGDAIIAFWNAPHPVDHPELRCVLTALACAESLRTLNAAFRARNWPEIHIRIGIAAGTCLFGNVGYSERFDFSVIGRPVERAQRLEGFNKGTGTSICVDEHVRAATHTHILYRPLDSIPVDQAELPGAEAESQDTNSTYEARQAYMMVYEPICHRSAVTPDRQRFVDSYELCFSSLEWGMPAQAAHALARHRRLYPWDRAVDVVQAHLAEMAPGEPPAEPHFPEQFSSINEAEYNSYDSISLTSADSAHERVEGIPTLMLAHGARPAEIYHQPLHAAQAQTPGLEARALRSARRRRSSLCADIPLDLPPPRYDAQAPDSP